MSKLTINWPDRVADEFPMPDSFSYEEMALIKRVTGLRAGELVDALIVEDADVAVAYAAIALRRADAGLSDFELREKLGQLSYGSIELDWTDDEEGKPDSPPAGRGGGRAGAKRRPSRRRS